MSADRTPLEAETVEAPAAAAEEPDGKGKTRIQARNEARILDAAQEIFAARGLRGATVDAIAEKAGLSKPNLHYYFRRKSDLYVAVLRRTLDIWLEPFAELDPEGDPAVELRRYIAKKLEMSRLYPSASRVFANEMLQGAPMLKGYLSGELRALVDRKAQVIRHWIATGRLREVDPHHLVFLIWAATQHYADFDPQVRAVLGKERMTKADYAEVEDSLCRIILGGLVG